jgi:hypothetical protein
MSLFFSEHVFPKADKVNNVDLTTIVNPGTDHPDLKYKMNCDFGQCSMLSVVKDDKLTLTVNVSPDASAAVVIGTMRITTGSISNLAYKCEYGTTIQVSSSDFKVDHVSIGGEQIGQGDLKGGFSISFINGAADQSFVLGSTQGVDVTWAVTTLTGVDFFVNKCQVKDGTNSVMIVNEQCHSSALKVTRLTHPTSVTNIRSFEYPVFVLVGVTSSDMSLECEIKICSNCVNPTTDENCPSTGTDTAYTYTVNGFNGPKAIADRTT